MVHYMDFYSVESIAVRKEQWASYLGPIDKLYVGEYNVFILYYSTFRNKTGADNAYLSSISNCFLLFDNIYAYWFVDCFH